MKKLLLVAAIILLPKLVLANPRQTEPDFIKTSSATVVTLSASAWTLLPVSTSGIIAQNNAVWVSHKSNNTQTVLLMLTTSNVAPATTAYGYIMPITQPPAVLSYGPNLFLWGISDTQAQTVLVQPFQ